MSERRPRRAPSGAPSPLDDDNGLTLLCLELQGRGLHLHDDRGCLLHHSLRCSRLGGGRCLSRVRGGGGRKNVDHLARGGRCRVIAR